MTDAEMKEYMENQVQEMLKHKWYESEKAGFDVGSAAFKDYIEKYAAEYREKWEKEHSSINIENSLEESKDEN